METDGYDKAYRLGVPVVAPRKKAAPLSEGSSGYGGRASSAASRTTRSKTAAASPLADGDVLQFAWCDSVPNVVPTAEQWKALASEAAQGDGVAGDENAAKPRSAYIAIVEGMKSDDTVADLLAKACFTAAASSRLRRRRATSRPTRLTVSATLTRSRRLPASKSRHLRIGLHLGRSSRTAARTTQASPTKAKTSTS
ncbi:MAG: hypothetical protein V8R48_14845 [Eggerthella lenta]